MYNYIRELGKQLPEDDLVETLGMVAVLNEQPFCKNWTELIGAVGVEGMLCLCETLGGQTITLPTIYQVLMVYAAIMTLELCKTKPYEEAKEQVIGRLCLDGFDELVTKIKSTQTRIAGAVKSTSS